MLGAHPCPLALFHFMGSDRLLVANPSAGLLKRSTSLLPSFAIVLYEPVGCDWLPIPILPEWQLILRVIIHGLVTPSGLFDLLSKLLSSWNLRELELSNGRGRHHLHLFICTTSPCLAHGGEIASIIHASGRSLGSWLATICEI